MLGQTPSSRSWLRYSGVESDTVLGDHEGSRGRREIVTALRGGVQHGIRTAVV